MRKKVNYKKSKKIFQRTANRTHPKNIKIGGSRGGIRL